MKPLCLVVGVNRDLWLKLQAEQAHKVLVSLLRTLAPQLPPTSRWEHEAVVGSWARDLSNMANQQVLSLAKWLGNMNSLSPFEASASRLIISAVTSLRMCIAVAYSSLSHRLS